jgi:hypothetical protein
MSTRRILVASAVFVVCCLAPVVLLAGTLASDLPGGVEWRIRASGYDGLRSGVLIDLPYIRMFGIYNTYQSDAAALPHVFVGYGAFDLQFSFLRTYEKNGWDDIPVHPAVSVAVMLSPAFGWYHPQIGVGVWLSRLPRIPLAEEREFYRSYFTRVSLVRFGFSFGRILLDLSVADFFYGSCIPVNTNPGFRVVGNTSIGVNLGGFGLAWRWGAP